MIIIYTLIIEICLYNLKITYNLSLNYEIILFLSFLNLYLIEYLLFTSFYYYI